MEDEYYERDPRKRKVMSPVALIDERKDDRRRRSSSGSPDHRRKGLEEWQRKSDAFIKSMKASEGGYGASQGYPAYHSSQNYRDEKSLYEREKRERPDFRREHERRDVEPVVKVERDASGRSGAVAAPGRSGSARGGGVEPERSASPSAENRNVLMTQEKRDKLLKTIEEYEAGTEGYEKKLLKLKEHREELKAKGHKHEDNTMKENAKLQKEIKYRIQSMKEFIEQKKADYKGMEEELAAHKERERERERERMWREEQRMLEHQRKQAAAERNWDRESNGSAPETRRPNPDDAGRRMDPEIRRNDAPSWQEKLEPPSKKAKDMKLASASESESSSDSEAEQKKKRKKKKKKANSVSPSDSDSQTKKNYKKDDSDISSMMGKKKKSGKDEDFQDFFSKLNDSYNKTKQELAEVTARCSEMTSRCSEMTSRCSILENQNRVLKKQVEDLTSQLKEAQEATELRTIRNVDPYPVKREPDEFRDVQQRDFGNGKQREEFSGYKNYERGMKEGKEKKDGWKHDKFDGGHSPPPPLEKKGRDSEVRRDEEYSRFIKEFEPEPPASSKYDDRKDKAKSDDYDKYDKYDKNHEKYDKNHDKYEKRHHHRDASPEGHYGSGYGYGGKKVPSKSDAALSPSDDQHRYREEYDKRKTSYENMDKRSFDSHYHQQEDKRKVYQQESERRHYENDERRHQESDQRHTRYEEQRDERHRRYEEESRHYESEDSRRRSDQGPPADWNNRRPDSKNDRRRYDTDEDRRGRHDSGDSRHKQGVREESEERSRSRHDRYGTKYERYYGGDVETTDHQQSRDKKKKKRSRSRHRSYSRSASRSRSRSYDRSAKKKKKDKHRSRSSRSRSRSKDRKHKTRDTSSRSSSPSNRKSKSRKEKSDAINLDEWSKPPTKEGKEPLLNNLKEKIRAKEAERLAEESQNKWVPAEAQQPPPQQAPPVQQVKQRESLERGLSPSRASVNISWGQGVKKQAEQSAQPARKSATPMVGKMPWLKGNSSGSTTTTGRTSKFGPPVSQGTGIVPVVPPPQLVTAPVILGGSNDASNVPLPPMPPPPKDPPNFNTPPPNMMGMAKPPLPNVPKLPNLPPKIPRNPKPTSQVDMDAMLVAAKQHMQQSLNTKLSNIGLPPQPLGEAMPDSIPLPESIPIPGNPPSFPMDIEVPLPSEPAPPPSFNESAPTTSNYGAPDNYSATKRSGSGRENPDPAPPGEGPDLDELAMLGIDPSDSIV